jgi:predicted ester cyclase
MNKFYMILPMALILCFMVGCQDKGAMAELKAMKAQAEVEKQNVEIVQRIASEGNKNKNLDILSEVCSSDYKFVGQAFYIPFPDLIHKIEGIYVDGNTVVARYTLSGTYKADFQGIPPTGKKIEWSAIEIFRFSDGKLSELRVEWDGLGMMMQLGTELKPKEGEK